MKTCNLLKKVYSKAFFSIFYVLLIFAFLNIPPAAAKETVSSVRNPDQVILQLKWIHQFNFAGYYAAVEKGFYKEAGFEVTIKEGKPDMDFVDEVVSGRADYGVEMPELLIARNNGKPVVVLAAIFQHSPQIILARADSGIRLPHNLIGKKVMWRFDSAAELRAMLLNEKVPLEQIEFKELSWNINDLIDGKVDAIHAYITDQPLSLEKAGIESVMLHPINYGIDFYGDCLFTSETKISENPDRVRAFREASLQGWKYAMENPEEVMNIIRDKYGTKSTREYMRNEFKHINKLILPQLIEIGHINPGRWKHIGDTFVRLGLLNPDYSLDGFLYDPNPEPDYTKVMRIIWILLSVVALISISAIVLLFYNRKLEREIRKRTSHLSAEIAEHKQTLFQLNLEKDLAKKYLDVAGVMIVVIDTAQKVSLINKKGCEIIGYKEDEIIGENWFQTFLPERMRDEVITVFNKLMAGEIEPVDYYENPVLTKSGEERIVGWYNTLLKNEEGIILATLSSGDDITENKKAAEALKESEETLRLSQETAEIGSWTWDIESHRLHWTDRVYRMFGFDPAKPPPYEDFLNCINPHDKGHVIQAIERSLNEKEDYDIEYRIIRPDDEIERIIHAKGKAIYDEKGIATRMMGIVHDITERKRAEDNVLRAGRIESIGVLAGGIAHDFNNFLAAILNNLYLIKMLTKSDGKIQERIESTEKAAMKAQSLTQQLLTFSKGGEPIKRLVNIRDIMNESASLSLRGSNVHCESCKVDDLWHVEVDEGQISQVFNNLIINADQSMSEGGTISVDCQNVTVEAETFIPLKKGEYVKVSIKDQGTGIPEEDIARIFDPYFTTKEKGSGLGLATAYSVVKRHDGHIEVESTAGLGTAFHIYLPASRGKAPYKELPEAKPIPGEGKILIMDDDELVRDSLGQLLENLGYRSEYAIDGRETVEAYRNAMASGEPFDVVIMDLTIPGGEGGRDTIGKLKSLDPNVKAIVSSGYSHDPVMAQYRNYGFKAVLTKPYKDVVELSEILDKVIKNK